MGGTREVYDYTSGNINFATHYEPYGKKFGEYQNIRYDITQQFTGKELDKDYDLTYFGARYYDQDIGLWTSTDPAREFSSPYSYSQNPVNTIDPDGLTTYLIRGQVVGVVADGSLEIFELDPDLPSHVGYTDRWFEFASPEEAPGLIEPGFVPGIISAQNNYEETINRFNMEVVSNMSPPFGWLGLAWASRGGGRLDIKTQLGQGNGGLYKGKFISGKSAGNILFGKNTRSLLLPYSWTKSGAGA